MIGRYENRKEFYEYMRSDRSELVVITGRRRVGKTYMINELFGDKFAFTYTGGHHLNKQRQLQNFAIALQTSIGSATPPVLNDWFDAFMCLQQLLSTRKKREKKVVFIDEMPWIDTPRSEFVAAFENFWNSWAAQQKDILFIATGSATSWMSDKLFDNQGGLHNRITHRITLKPFTLAEVEEYMTSKGGHWDRYQLAQAYMIFGGVPYYWSLIDVKQSLAQNVNRLFFVDKAPMRTEFDELYYSLFAHADKYIEVVRCLSQHRSGLTRNEIMNMTHLQGNTLTKVLTNLCLCDFCIDFVPINHAKQGTIYRLTDFYTHFYFRFVEQDNSKDPERWTHILKSPQVAAWQGLTFELICMLHLQQIKRGLGIEGMETKVSTWRDNDMQIDLIIDRADRLVNLCEMKFSQEPYIIKREYADHLRLRNAMFREKTKMRKGIINTFITTYGVLPTKNSSIADTELQLDSLFAKK